MPGVVIVFLLERIDEPRHLHSCDEALSFAFPKPHDSHSWVGVIPWDESGDLPPVEHLAHDFQDAVGRIRVLRRAQLLDCLELPQPV
jgi:hypothetical protein